jgi:acetone carboxylase gamma subunit
VLSLACLSDMLGFSSSVRLCVSTLLFVCDNCQTKLTHTECIIMCVCVCACAETGEVSVRNEWSIYRILLA